MKLINFTCKVLKQETTKISYHFVIFSSSAHNNSCLFDRKSFIAIAMVVTMLRKLQKYFSILYLRYLLATEMYIVEPWEVTVMHIIILIVFMGFWYLNYSIVLGAIGSLTNSASLQVVS